MSGELLRVRIERGFSIVTVVRRGAIPSSVSTLSSQSPSTTRSARLKRVVGVLLRVAPRALIDSTAMQAICADDENEARTLSAVEAHFVGWEGGPAMLGKRAQGRLRRPGK